MQKKSSYLSAKDAKEIYKLCRVQACDSIARSSKGTQLLLEGVVK